MLTVTLQTSYLNNIVIIFKTFKSRGVIIEKQQQQQRNSLILSPLIYEESKV